MYSYLSLDFWLTDDAFISFRYALNFIHGYGLVYNHGEHVLGFTNFLWVILLSFFKILGLDFRYTVVILNCLSSISIGFILYKILKKIYEVGNLTLILLFALLTFSFPPLLCWSIGGGLEGPFFSSVIFLSFYLLFNNTNDLHKLFVAGIILGFSSLIRPEGVIFFILGGIFLFKFSENNNKVKTIIFTLSGYLVIVIPYVLWTFYYFGSPIPNTFTAKVDFSIAQFFYGAKYIYRFFMSSPLSGLSILLFPLIYKNANQFGKMSFWIIVTYLAYIILVGGDFMFGFRFIIPILPFFSIIFFEIFKFIIGCCIESSKRNFYKLAIMVIAFFTIFNIFSIINNNYYRTEIKNYNMIKGGEIAGKYFSSKYPSSFLIASSGIGSLGYYSKQKILDVLGLTDKIISKSRSKYSDEILSHSRSDANYVLHRMPDIIIFDMPSGTKFPRRIAEKEIFHHPDFQKYYIYVETTEQNNNTIIRYYIRKTNI
jgi:hypothetical protein